jgi:regulator of RNase E activity RraA
MSNPLAEAFAHLSTPLIADACVSLGLPLRVAPAGIRPVVFQNRVAGRICPLRHFGSVDVFLEALQFAGKHEVLVIDNGGRIDEGCIGELITLEAKMAGLSGIALWGAHRDPQEIMQIDFPVFSYGTCPVGPQTLRARDANALEEVQFGDVKLTKDDIVFGDSDGVLFSESNRAAEIMGVAQKISQRERAQATLVQNGKSLRNQLRFEDYQTQRAADPSYTFRMHFERLGAAIEK